MKSNKILSSKRRNILGLEKEKQKNKLRNKKNS
jgi:hypothetical protein